MCTMILSHPFAKAMIILVSRVVCCLWHNWPWYLFYMLERYVGIGDSSLWLIRSWPYTKPFNFMADFASLLCRVPQGSVMGPIKLCLYLLLSFLCILFSYANTLYMECIAHWRLAYPPWRPLAESVSSTKLDSNVDYISTLNENWPGYGVHNEWFVMEDFIMINRQKHYTNIYMIG